MYAQNYKKLIIYYFHKIICIAYLHKKNLQFENHIFLSRILVDCAGHIKVVPIKNQSKDDFWNKYRLYDDKMMGFPLKEEM